jgi:hypothetical protein
MREILEKNRPNGERVRGPAFAKRARMANDNLPLTRLPHFVRFTRALALVTGCAGAIACSGTGRVEGDQRCASVYDGCPTGTLKIPGYSTGVDASPPHPYDGGPTGTPPVYDGGEMGTTDGGEVGPPILTDAAPDYDGWVTGLPPAPDAAPIDLDAGQVDVFMGGGPLAPPEMPG